MQPLEALGNPPSTKDSFESQGATVNSSRADSDFGRFMDSALPAPTGSEKAAHVKTKPTAKTKPLTAKLSANDKTVNGAGKFPPGENLDPEIVPQQKHPGILDEVKSLINVAGESNPVNLIGGPPPDPVNNSTPPIFLTLPLAGQFNAGAVNEPVKTEKSSGTEVEKISAGQNPAPVTALIDRNTGRRLGGFVPAQLVAESRTDASKATADEKNLVAPLATENSQANAADLKLTELSPVALVNIRSDGAPNADSARFIIQRQPAGPEFGAPISPDAPVTDLQISTSGLKSVLPTVAITTPVASMATAAENSVEVVSATALLKAEPSIEKFPPVASPFYAAMSASAASEKLTGENAGTGVALDASAMKNAENMNKVAGLDAKVLPGGKVSRAAAEFAPQMTAVSARSQENSNSDFNLPIAVVSPIAAATENAVSITLPSLTDAHLRMVERTQDMVVMHAMRLAKSDAESLSVVIRPGGGAELSLELRQRNGETEALAVLQRGDFQMLNQHWPELQAKLEQRGIKLAALGSEANGFSFTGDGNSSGKNSAREEQTRRAAAFAEFTVAMNRGGATARYSPPVNGLEWWA